MRTRLLLLSVVAGCLWAAPAWATCDTANPTNPENDCDNDGCKIDQGDCNDSDPNMHPTTCGLAATAVEVCDGKDNNCSGGVDEGDPGSGAACGTGKAGICAAGIKHCVAGAIACVQTNAATTETCNGLDDNCDGTIDEGTGPGGKVSQSCYDGPGGTQGVGLCKAGQAACTATPGSGVAAWSSTCTGEVVPAAEVCDGKDNDCNGTADNGDPGSGASCSTGKSGVCAAGVNHCISGAIACVQTTASSAEVCDGLDNDCNGSVDDGTGPGGKVAQSCYDGPGGTSGVGLCKTGLAACTATVGSGTAAWSSTCTGEVLPTTETCNGKDDNCNGTVDDGFNVGTGCTVGGKLGVCAVGTYSCSAGVAVCTGPAPSTEVCDGKDNNCDGNVDEGNPGGGGSCTVSGQKGLCATGVKQCTSGALACNQTVFPVAEICDNKDNDCDGVVDNGLITDADSDGVRACGTCNAPNAPNCDCNDSNAAIKPGATEVCDGVDNNCNGQIDENLTRVCYTGAAGTYTGTCGANPVNCAPYGACHGVTQTCTGGAYPVCNASVAGQNTTPVAETCNNIDDNCNGTVDEGLTGGACTTAYPGICAAGTIQCANGTSQCIATITPGSRAETCNNKDDNCDGLVDNNVTPQKCFDGAAGTFTGTCPGPGCTPKGECRAGTQACDGSGNWLACSGEVLPTAEVCDSKDNNCNGSVDEGLITDADGDGVRACNTCGANPAGSCDCNDNNANIRPGKTEVCDGLDNNCDGQVDEGTGAGGKLSQNCYDGASGTQGVGLCTAGVQVCTATAGSGTATWGTCSGEVVPATETCDGKDNNCNGTIDEGFDADHDGFVSCAACGNPTNCDCDDTNPNVHPGAVELCDMVDQNCNGRLDDVPSRVCFSDATGVIPSPVSYTGTCPGPTCSPKGECKAGTQSCTAAGAWGTCAGVVLPVGDPTQPETTCNGKDDNCNGLVDDGAFDKDGDGYTTCAGDCDDNDPAVHPGALEICDNKDNDCDGHIDGNSTSCYTGPAGTVGVGVCASGTATCVAGMASGTCTGEVKPTAEVCDGLDNDCDGKIDEDFDHDGDGAVSCAECNNRAGCDCDDHDPFNAPGKPEICDCQDNNCNGIVDDNSVCLAAPCHDFDGDGFTNCQGDCDDHNAAIGPNRTEIVGNGVDDDCNGRIDEDVDMDGDGYSTGQGDCDDHSKAINPGAAEVCDGFDNNCDGRVDEGFDEDHDFATTCAGDCNDHDPTVSPFLTEVCGNGKDDNCDGRIDEDTDLDGDGVTTCQGDCNDYQASVHPAFGSIAAAPEICDGQDNDCNGIFDDGFDKDGDYAVSCLGDCDDNDPNINPSHWEVPANGKDDNCNGQIDEGSQDNDHDGFTPICGDCNDADPNINPHATEVCDRVDNNCDGFVDCEPGNYQLCAVCFDGDHDGQTNCDGDCNDADPTIYRGAPELCDLKDNDCDGLVDIDPGTGFSVCKNDGGVTDAGVDAGVDAGTPTDDAGTPTDDAGTGPTPDKKVVATGCGCTSTEGTAPLALVAVVALAFFSRRRQVLRVRAPVFGALGALVVLLTLTGCPTTSLRVPTDAGQTDGADAGAADGGDAGTDAGFIPPVEHWPCPGLYPVEMLLTPVPATESSYAHSRDFTVTSTQVDGGVGVVMLDDGTHDVAAFVLRRPLPTDVDAGDPTALETVASREIAGLDALSGTPLVQDRIERFARVFVSEKDTRNFSSAQTLSFATPTNAFALRNRMVSALGQVSPSDLGSLPVVAGAPADTDLIVYLFLRVTKTDLFIGAAITTAADFAATQPTLNDLTNGSHLSLPNPLLIYDCEHHTAPVLKTDFLFVIDDSGSMVEEQAALSAASAGLFDAFQASGLDFRVGVVSTDSDVLRGDGFTSDLNAFKADVHVGINGNSTEMGIEYGLRAIQKARVATDPRFKLRDDAGLVVVFMSDEDNTGLQTLAQYEQAYTDQKAVCFAITGPRPTGCTRVGLGMAHAGTEYIDLATATGGSSGSICNPKLTEVIEEVLFGALGASGHSPLGKRPVSGSLDVQTDHVVNRARSHGFDYDPGSNSVLFFGEVPPSGSNFDAAYAYFQYIL
jgi:MYXO-CTERM domain-containing protein